MNRITGATSVAGVQDAPAPNCRVLLFLGTTPPTLVAETHSDAVAQYAFDWLRHGDDYTALALDPANQYDPVCKTNLVPSPMPPDPSEHP